MAIAIKSTAEAGAKWKRRASSAAGEYEEGVKNPRKSWEAETVAATEAYKAGIQKSLANDSFSKGVKAAGNTKWQKNAIEKGPARFSQGVELAQGDYEKGFAPYRAAIAGLTLPKRGPKGDPNNIRRVELIAKTLHNVKLQRLGQ